MKKILLIASQKGGTGKSTITANLAAMCVHQGFKTLVVDGDMQGTTTSFWNRREDKGFDLKKIENKNMNNAEAFDKLIEAAKPKYDVILIDVGGHDNPMLRIGLSSAHVDTLLSPILPSFADVETLTHVNDLVKASRAYNANLKAWVLLSRTHSNPNVKSKKLAREFVEEFCDELTPLKTTVTEREVVKTSFAHALSVLEFESNLKRGKKATPEMQFLYQELFGVEFNALGQ